MNSSAAAPPLASPTEAEVEEARGRLRGLALHTPLIPLRSEHGPDEIYLNLENLQPLGSFKIRPAANVLQSTDRANLQRGVLTASAGIAAALAGFAGKGKIVCIISDGNIDVAKLSSILEGNSPV